MNALKDTLTSSATDRIDGFTKRFGELAEAFDRGIVVQTAIMSSRMLQKVETIGK